jgi:uncharacterized protein YecE (DUF72 family)
VGLESTSPSVFAAARSELIRFAPDGQFVHNSGMPFERSKVKQQVAALAERGVFIGTSSWKYLGWRGSLYDEQRYIWRGKFGEKRFGKYCLAEYAEVFKTVCVDAAYYKFPDPEYLSEMVCQVPDGFRFAFKVTDEITIKHFPNLPRFGARAGRPNPNFLNADLFVSAFLKPLEKCPDKVGVMIFEFSKFYSGDFGGVAGWIQVLDRFLSALPNGWPYGIEIRNQDYLTSEYFGLLKARHVAHVFNSWNEMPAVSEQLCLEGCHTHDGLSVARLLLKPGRNYEQAVKLFSPYERLQEPNPDARLAAVTLIKRALLRPQHSTYIYVNNRLEGNALETIAQIIEAAVPVL